MKLLWIAVGGAAGSVARYLVSGLALRLAGPGFPAGTLAVNLAGSFLVALVMELALSTELVPPTLRIAFVTGVLGGFTTYSTFNYETLEYLRQGAWAIATANVAATLCGCLAAGIGGLALGRWMSGA